MNSQEISDLIDSDFKEYPDKYWVPKENVTFYFVYYFMTNGTVIMIQF